MSQWYTVVAVMRPSLDGEIHFQNTTGCAIWKLFILDFISRLKICRLSPAAPATVALRAITLLAGFISAESAVIGRLSGLSGAAMSTITTEFVGPVSRMQMYLSLSIVTLVKEMNCGLMPRLGSCARRAARLSRPATKLMPARARPGRANQRRRGSQSAAACGVSRATQAGSASAAPDLCANTGRCRRAPAAPP